jgi:hypothetical protein
MTVSAFGALVLGIVTLALPGHEARAAGNRCAADKLKATGKKADCLLALHSREAATGDPPASLRLQACKDRLGQAFLKAEDRPPCLTITDAEAIESKVDVLVDDVDTALSVGTPNPCQSAKIKATGRKAKCLLAVSSTAVRKGEPPSASKLQRCRDKILQAFLRAEARFSCGTTSDAHAIEGKVDAFTDDVVAELTSPTTTSFVTTSTTTSTTTPTCNCCSALPSLLAFTTVALGGAPTGQVLPARCVQGPNIGTACTTDADCTGGGVCRGHLDRGALYYGSGQPPGLPLPAYVPAGGLSYFKTTACAGGNPILTAASSTDGLPGCATPSGTPTWGQRHCTSPGCLIGPPFPIPSPMNPATSFCAINQVDAIPEGVSGTLACATGAVELALPLASHMYLTGSTVGTQACSLCVGGSVGVCGSGTCNAGSRIGLSCTPETPALTTHDCPPPTGTFIDTAHTVLDLTSGTRTMSAFDTSGQLRVFCGYCFDPTDTLSFETPPHPCTSDAECTNGNFDSCRQHQHGAFRSALATTITQSGIAPEACVADGLARGSTLVSVFCIPPTYVQVLDAFLDLPGPGTISLPGSAQFIP